jgi:hypothetical protein
MLDVSSNRALQGKLESLETKQIHTIINIKYYKARRYTVTSKKPILNHMLNEITIKKKIA